MFTGLVETMGTVAQRSGDTLRRLTVASALPPADIRVGDSIAIDGCCLTVVEKGLQGLTFEAATETLQRTTLGALQVGDNVNLERSLRLGDRLDGHLVAGHVDGVGTVRQREQKGSALYLGIEAPLEVSRLTAARGSITVAGVSLTVTGVEGHVFFIGLIPHTVQVTTLGAMQVGQRVNLEADLLARYVERLWQVQGPALTGSIPADKGRP